jgi:serine/threonine-protein kinase
MSGAGWARLLEGHVVAGRYALERLIGEGGMGAVFSATQLAVQRRVAVKVLLPGVGDDASVVERFHREARLVAQIARRGVPQVIDFDQDPVAGPFVVMELLAGEALADHVRRRGAMHPRDAAAVVVSMLETLEVVHAKGVVHRDIKPANVFLAREGAERVVKVLDFGIARVTAPHGEMTRDGAVLGTPRYMAPEQANGDRSVDARADVYGAGGVLYACLSGRQPYEGLSGEAVLVAVRARPPEPIASLGMVIPAPLVAVVERAMVREPAARYASAAEMRRALVEAMRDLPAAPPPSAPAPSTVPGSAQATVAEGSPPATPSAGPGGAPLQPPLHGLPRPADPSGVRTTRNVVAGASALIAAVGATAVVLVARGRAKAPVAPPAVPVAATAAAAPDDPATRSYRVDLDAARAAWRTGDGARAHGMLEHVVSEIEHAGVRAPSPGARIAGEATILLGDLDEREILAPPDKKPESSLDFGPTILNPALEAAMRAIRSYGSAAAWGAMDLAICSETRQGHVWEKLLAMSVVLEKRMTALVGQPGMAALFGMPPGDLASMWKSSVDTYRHDAIITYEGAVTTARYATGPSIDPGDGSDCEAAALARRDALQREDDGGR